MGPRTQRRSSVGCYINRSRYEVRKRIVTANDGIIEEKRVLVEGGKMDKSRDGCAFPRSRRESGRAGAASAW